MYNKDESKHSNESNSTDTKTTTTIKKVEEQINIKELIEKVKMKNYLSSKELLEQTTAAIEGYYIKKDNIISLYAYKMYGSDALCTILEKPI